MFTASKESQLKKVLIKTGVVLVLIVLALLIAGFILSNYDTSLSADVQVKQNENGSLQSQCNDIMSAMGMQDEVVKFYDVYSKNHNTDFALNRDTIANVLAPLGKKYHLAKNVEVTVSPITDLTENKMAIKGGKAVKSTIHISFGALNDTSLYNLLYDLQHMLPGIVLVSDLKMDRIGDVSKGSMEIVTKQHAIAPLVTGELSLIWLGIRPENTPANGPNNVR